MTAYLVTIETQSGIQPQIWHADKKGGFVGCAHLKPITKIELVKFSDEPYTIEQAIAFAASSVRHDREET
jgi:hypothetical protein